MSNEGKEGTIWGAFAGESFAAAAGALTGNPSPEVIIMGGIAGMIAGAAIHDDVVALAAGLRHKLDLFKYKYQFAERTPDTVSYRKIYELTQDFYELDREIAQRASEGNTHETVIFNMWDDLYDMSVELYELIQKYEEQHSQPLKIKHGLKCLLGIKTDTKTKTS